jgi:Putative auto-transporter adhesin, head GIN domain
MRYVGIRVALALVIGAGACGLGAVGNGNLTNTSRALMGFSRVRVEGEGVTTVREGASYAVTVTTDANIQVLVDTRVQDDTLIVDAHDILSTTDLRIDIQLPILRGATLAGSGTLHVGGVSARKDVDLALSGSGSVDFSGAAAAVTASLSGSGRLTLVGSADLLSASLSGSGQLDARDLPTNQATLDLGGSGRLQATAVQSVALHLGGSGEIEWWGPASVSTATVDGSGQITHH